MLDQDEKLHQVAQLIVRRFTAGHLAHTNGVQYLAHDIVRYFDGAFSLWAKWSTDRTKLLHLSKTCWIPVEGLQEALNSLPGPSLTATDIEQRLKVLWETTYEDLPREDLQDSCLEIFNTQRAEGTEFIAIVGAIRDYLDEVSLREAHEKFEREERQRQAARIAQEQRLRAGADCDWTSLGTKEDLFLRDAGRLFRLSKISHLEWELSEIPSLDRAEEGKIIGRFKGRGLARAAVYDMTSSTRAPDTVE